MARKFLLGTIALLTIAGAAAPALAVPYCTDRNTMLSFDAHISTGFGFGGPRSREEVEMQDYAMKLRRRGVDVTSVDKWNGCLQAFVRGYDGKITMQFFDPNTLEPVE